MRTACAVDEIHVDVDGLAVAASAHRNPALHLVEVQGPGAFVTGSPAHGLAGPWRDVELRVDPGRRDLGDFLDGGRQDTVRYEEDVAAETGAFVPGADLGDDPGGCDQAAVWNIANGDDDIVELQVGAVLHGDVPPKRGRVQQALHSAYGASRHLD